MIDFLGKDPLIYPILMDISRKREPSDSLLCSERSAFDVLLAGDSNAPACLGIRYSTSHQAQRRSLVRYPQTRFPCNETTRDAIQRST